MGYFGKLEEKAQAVALRKRGLSYSEIRQFVHVSKDTISRWCRDLSLTPAQTERLLKRKLEGSQRGRIVGAKRQQLRRIRKTKSLKKLGMRIIGNLSKRDRFMSGIALYLGEGYKGDKTVGFANSDPAVITFMMRWFREFCQIPEQKFTGQIWIHDNLDEARAKEFWSKLTGIPQSQFYKSYIARNKTASRKIRKNLHEFGVFSVKIANVALQRKILGYMAGLLTNPLV